VTVEASSPALIEKTRTVVTDGEGQYKIIDLRAGVYTGLNVSAAFQDRPGPMIPANYAVVCNTAVCDPSTYTPATATTANPWQTPTSILQGRLFKVGAQFSFRWEEHATQAGPFRGPACDVRPIRVRTPS